jgi:hypothetical protein
VRARRPTPSYAREARSAAIHHPYTMVSIL